MIFSLTGGSTGEVRELDLARSNRIDQTPAPDRLTLNTGSSLAVGNGLYGATTTDPNPDNARFNVQVLNGSTLAHSTLDSTQGSQATFNATTVVDVRSAVLDTLGRSVLSAERLVSGSGSFTIGAGGTVRSDSTELSQSSSLSPRGFTEVLAGGTADFGTLDLNDVSLLRINGGDVTANDVTIRSETSGVLVGIELLSGSFRADSVRLDSLLRLVGGTFSAESIQVTRGVGNLRWFDTDVTIRNAGQTDFIGSPGLFGNDEFVPTNGSLTYEGALTHQDDLFVLGRLVAQEGITNIGTFQVFGGSIDGGVGGIDNFTRITLDDGTIDGTLRTFGNSSVDVTGESRLTGDVSGRGRFTGTGDAIFSGTLAPGDDLGTATIAFTGNVEIDLAGTIVFDLFDLDNFDRLTIDGVLTLSGDLEVSLFGDYRPTAGDRYDLVDAGTILVGANAGFLLPTLGAGLAWDTSAFAATGTLAVVAVPEPGTLVLLALGGTLLLARRLRGRSAKSVNPNGSVVALALTGCLTLSTATALRADVFGSGTNEFTLEFVTVGDPGNPADRGTTGSFFAQSGAVTNPFRMGTFEVSRANVLAANAPVASGGGGLGITVFDYDRNNVGRGNGDNRPASGISWFEAARFVNWLNTSHGHSAAYKFDLQSGDSGYDANASNLLWTSADPGYNPSNPFRNSNAVYFLPTENEWYKAAFYSGSGDTYFDYATGSDTAPTSVSGGTLANTAVYQRGNFAGPAAVDNAGGRSFYGTVGQNGNVFEWTESPSDGFIDSGTETRIARGGHWNAPLFFLDSAQPFTTDPALELSSFGFRVAAVAVAVPEPKFFALLPPALAAALILVRLRRRRKNS